MPLTQEKRLDNNFSNNNDHSYLHKKFKKMASTISMLPGSTIKGEETGYQETSLLQVTSNSTITNGSIAAAHPEIEKIKDRYEKHELDVGKNVQINFNDENFRLSDPKQFVQIPGKTSFSEEFLNKTENLENEFIKETNSGGTGRYICPYCKISCAKPSVLQKHIRAHTNERPYPCIPCGFAFKTKSNLYKHRRSRTHALRLQGADIATAMNDDDLSGDSESDTSIPPTSLSGSDRDQSSDTIIRAEKRPNEFSSPELTNEGNNVSLNIISTLNDNRKSKAIYKPKFRAAFYHGMDEKDKIKKTISQNANFLTEHISKIISDNEAIVDVIETPLQKKYGKIKQIAESKQFLSDVEITPDVTPLNLTKNFYESDNLIRKRSHSESFAQIVEDQKHPLNPEGSIIKDLLLKTKANGLNSVTSELVDGFGPLYVCPLCQIVYRSADNLDIHRLYYCKGALSNNSLANNIQKEIKSARPENIFVRSNSINVRLPENVTPVPRTDFSTKSPPLKNKPDNLILLKQDFNDVVAPLPSPGPLLGNTRLVDARIPTEFNKKTETFKIRSMDSSPKRKLDSRSETYSPRLHDNSTPRSADLYAQPKIRCIEVNSSSLRSMEEMSPHIRHNSTSLQMFGGEVKIVDHSGSTTTLRIEPSKTQLSPILIHQNLSPSKYANESEASSVVVRSGLHSGGTIVHNPPTPKETINTSQIQTSRISVSTPNTHNSNFISNIRDVIHFQFPPLSAITAYNPLTLPPLSPSTSPNGATTIFHGGKLIPHVPGIPGPNTPGVLIGNNNPQMNNTECPKNVANTEITSDSVPISLPTGKGGTVLHYDRVFNSKSPNIKSQTEVESLSQYKDDFSVELQNTSKVPIIKIKHVDDPDVTISFPVNNNVRSGFRTEGAIKRNAEGFSRMPKDNSNYLPTKSKIKDLNFLPFKNTDGKSDNEIKNFNFENLITKVEIYNNQSFSESQKNCNETSSTSFQNERSETSYFQKNLAAKSISEERKPKFLRPSTLPLKPGTFTPKKHHGITPNANTMPLVSPETPRPAKAYGQLYLNGNAYTYLGLKCSTKVFYCTINRPQPTYVPNQHFLSMYSNWQLLSELTPDPLGLSASSAMSLYDSRHRPQNVAVAVIKQDLILTHSSQWNKNLKDSKQIIPFMDTKNSEDMRNITDNITTQKKELTGGFESNEEYTYVRGRGRGRYVCSECGIRCKKPSMLKKHIRTHTDVRPYTCVHCVFSFKTKGNLTKHMKSKAHYKKCCELGINPNDGNDLEGIEMSGLGETDDDSDSEGDEGNEGETESSDTEIYKSRLPEHEAAHCLLSLGGSRPTTTATPGLITSARPSTYPYTPIPIDSDTDIVPEKLQAVRTPLVDSRMEVDNEPMDLSKNELKTPTSLPEIPTARESSVLASLASNTAKLPQHQSQWVNGEPMLQTYLTERALLDSKIKQSQLTCNPKTRKIDLENYILSEKERNKKSLTSSSIITGNFTDISNRVFVSKEESIAVEISQKSILNAITEARSKTPNYSHSENAHKHLEFSKHTRIKPLKTNDNSRQSTSDNIVSEESNENKVLIEERTKMDDHSENIETKLPLSSSEYDSVAAIEGKDFEGTSYTPEKLIEDDRRVCYFCNETFTKPSRPFRCSICAVSFRTKGHLQVHERSTSHNIKISMTPNSENAKHVVSEYLKHARIKPTKTLDDSVSQPDVSSDESNGSKILIEEKIKMDDNLESAGIKMPLTEFDSVASKDVTEDFERTSCSPGKVTDDGWRDCDFCSKMFREPSQLKLHLNIHYMEKPFRCSVCAISYRTKGYLQKHERSTYHSNKITKSPNSENAKYVVSEYLKHARVNPIKNLDEPVQNSQDISCDDSNVEKLRIDDSSDCDGIKLPPTEYDSVAPKVVIGVGGVAFKVTKGKDFEGTSYSPGKLMEDGRRVCDFCNKTFTKPSQLRLHLNIHYMERPFRCSVCAVSFRTRGHLQKHERSASHHNKVSMTSTFGAATSFNPRPFRCSDCNIAFRIHGHLAKHLRSKMHVMRLECLFKLPFGTFTEIERAGLSLTDIDTTDCASSLASLQSLARKLHEKDPTKLEYREPSGSISALPFPGRESSEDEDTGVNTEKTRDSVNDSEIKTIENGEGLDTELRINYSATDN